MPQSTTGSTCNETGEEFKHKENGEKIISSLLISVAIHFSILAWKISWTEEPSKLQSMGSQRVRHN